MDIGKGAQPSDKKRKSSWIIAGILMVASAACGWWLAGPSADDSGSQILATAPPADTIGKSAAASP